MADAVAHITEIRTAGVPTTDQDRALDFYVGKLGFEKRIDEPFGDGNRWIEVAPSGAATTVALLPTPPGSPVGIDTNIRFTTTDAEGDHTSMSKAGVDVDEVMHWPGVPPMVTFRDPDGNTLYLVERMD